MTFLSFKHTVLITNTSMEMNKNIIMGYRQKKYLYTHREDAGLILQYTIDTASIISVVVKKTNLKYIEPVKITDDPLFTILIISTVRKITASAQNTIELLREL